MSRLPVAVTVNELKTVSFEPAMPVIQLGSILTLPPALKYALMVLLSANVTDLSMVDVEFHVPELVDVPAAAVDIAVADGDPAATADARLARSVISAALIAMVSPAETDVEVIDVLV